MAKKESSPLSAFCFLKNKKMLACLSHNSRKEKSRQNIQRQPVLTYRIRMNLRLKWIQKQWIKKYINWNTIAVVYAFKLVYNKQTIAYFHRSVCIYVFRCTFFSKEMALLLTSYVPSLPICLFCLNLFRIYIMYWERIALFSCNGTKEKIKNKKNWRKKRVAVRSAFLLFKVRTDLSI